MSILPDIAANTNDLINASIKTETSSNFPPREYAWDFENNDFLLKDGKFQIVEGKEAVKIWIWKALHTIRLTYSIYSNSYGHDLNTIIGQGFSNSLIQSEAKRLVWQCLNVNSHITRIEGFTAVTDGDTLTVSFTAITDQGEVPISV